MSDHYSASAPQPAARDLMAVRVELDQQRRFRTEQLDQLKLDAAVAFATADQPRLQVTRVLELAAGAALSEIDAALLRIDSGSYGRCERCCEPVLPERLEVLPMARLCTHCQYATESNRPSRLSRSQAGPVAGRR